MALITNRLVPFSSFYRLPAKPRFSRVTESNTQPLLFNTLQVRSAIGQAGSSNGPGGINQRRKLSFRNVSNVVVQLLHSIKYSVEVPFSNIGAASSVHSVAQQQPQHFPPAGHKKVTLATVKVDYHLNYF